MVGGLIMAWLARNLDGTILIFNRKPSRCGRYNIKVKKDGYWGFISNNIFDEHQFDDCISIKLPFDADEKLIGKHITWKDEPIKI